MSWRVPGFLAFWHALLDIGIPRRMVKGLDWNLDVQRLTASVYRQSTDNKTRDAPRKKYHVFSKKHLTRSKSLKKIWILEKIFNIGTLVFWSFGPLVPWSSGPLVLWSLILGFVLWSSGPLVLWSPGPLVLWSPGPLVLWSPGPLVLWSSLFSLLFVLVPAHIFI